LRVPNDVARNSECRESSFWTTVKKELERMIKEEEAARCLVLGKELSLRMFGI
jgi:hypothetical protein